MTIYNLRKTPLSPFLTRMITLMYQKKLERLSSHCLSKLLCSLGIFELELNPEISSTYAHITGVNKAAYDSYNENQFFQLVVCYYLDSIGLLYNKPRLFFDKSSYEQKLVKSSFMTTSVNAANAYCFKRRSQAGYKDDLINVPDAAVLAGTVLMAASLYRERGSIDSFNSFQDMNISAPVASMGRINSLLGIKRAQVA